MRRSAWMVLGLAFGCSREPAREVPVPTNPAPSASALPESAASTNAPPPASVATAPPFASVAPPDAGGALVPADWQRCTKDAECTFVSLGCCDTTPVRRDHAAEAERRLLTSGRRYCPVKAVCGPSTDGTWKGAPGVCRGGVCGCDPSAPLVSNCLGN